MKKSILIGISLFLFSFSVFSTETTFITRTQAGVTPPITTPKPPPPPQPSPADFCRIHTC